MENPNTENPPIAAPATTTTNADAITTTDTQRPLCDILIQRVEQGFFASELYQKVYAKIKEIIETKEDTQVAFKIELDALLLEEDGETLLVTIKPSSRWYGVMHLLLHKDKLPTKLEFIVPPQKENRTQPTYDDGLLAGIVPSLIAYAQSRSVRDLVERGQLHAQIMVYLPRGTGRYFTTRGTTKVANFDREIMANPKHNLVIPVDLG